jgi:RNA polymerase sigma-70 factor (TIGR02943 family)
MKDQIEKTEISEWVKRYTGELYAWALRKTSDPQLSEDLVQDTFLAALESASGFNRESQPKTWLIGILKNKIADHYRKSLRLQLSDSEPAVDPPPFFRGDGHWETAHRPQPWQAESGHLTDDPAFNRVLDDCIERLPALMHACIRLKFLDEKKGEQICQELGLSNTNYWQIIHRGKLQLRDCLENNWFRAS